MASLEAFHSLVYEFLHILNPLDPLQLISILVLIIHGSCSGWVYLMSLLLIEKLVLLRSVTLLVTVHRVVIGILHHEVLIHRIIAFPSIEVSHVKTCLLSEPKHFVLSSF